MKILRIVLLLTVFAGASVAQAPQKTTQPPQKTTPPPQRPTEPDQGTIRVPVTLVNTVFTVADKNGKGKFITNLKQTDFKVFEDEKPQEVTFFSTETNLPLSIVLLVDTSGSIRDKLVLEQEAAIDFFYNNLKRGKDRAAVISFDSGVDLLQGFTDDTETLSNAVRKIRAGGGTSLYDAVYLAINGSPSVFPGLA